MRVSYVSSGRRGREDRRYFAGVDGGGTKTLAVVTDANGRILGRGRAGPGNPHVAGWPGASDAITRALARALREAGLRRPGATGVPVLASVCLGLAGVTGRLDARRVRALVRELGVARRVAVVTDGEILLAAGRYRAWPEALERRAAWGRARRSQRHRERRRAFVALVSGTGSICWGEDGRGTVARAGGWGYVLGDPGSGYALGLAALRHLARIHDGAARGTRFVRAFLRHTGARDLRTLLLRYTRTERPRSDVAALARPVLHLARLGETAARALLSETARGLAELVDAVAARLPRQPLELVMGGGLLCHEPRLRDEVLRLVRARPQLVTVVLEPAVGAAFLARTASMGQPIRAARHGGARVRRTRAGSRMTVV